MNKHSWVSIKLYWQKKIWPTGHVLLTPKDKRFSEQVEKRPNYVLSTKQNTQTHTLTRTHAHTMHMPWKYRCVYFSELIHHTLPLIVFFFFYLGSITLPPVELRAYIQQCPTIIMFFQKWETWSVFCALNCSLFKTKHLSKFDYPIQFTWTYTFKY